MEGNDPDREGGLSTGCKYLRVNDELLLPEEAAEEDACGCT